MQGKLKTKSLPQLKNVEIDLQTGVTTTVGGQITIFVFTIGGWGTFTQTAQTMKFTLTPPTATAADLETAQAKSTTPNFSAQFSAAIIAAAQAADIALANQQKPALELNSFTADIKFTIENIVQGGSQCRLTLLPVNLQGSGKVDPTNTHEAILTFAKPSSPSRPLTALRDFSISFLVAADALAALSRCSCNGYRRNRDLDVLSPALPLIRFPQAPELVYENTRDAREHLFLCHMRRSRCDDYHRPRANRQVSLCGVMPPIERPARVLMDAANIGRAGMLPNRRQSLSAQRPKARHLERTVSVVLALNSVAARVVLIV